MQAIVLPEPIARLVAAVNDGRAERFAAQFAPDATVDDWGARHVGTEAIRRWSERELFGARGRWLPCQAQQSDNRIILTADWASDGYKGRSRLVFVVAGEHILEMTITSA